MEYTRALFHNSLSQYLSNDTDGVLSETLHYYPYTSYDQALKETGLTSLHER